jgi:flagellar motor switch protein FliN/FliY
MTTEPNQTPEPSANESTDIATMHSAQTGSEQSKPLDRILEIKIPIIVKIVEKPITISSILKLNIGSVITFTKDAYQHVDLMVNNTTIGLGQPVKIGEKFGLRITQVGPLEDRIKLFGGQADE